MLVGFGIQTILLFLGYALGLDYGLNRAGLAGGVGMLGGYLLAGAGCVAAARPAAPLRQRRSRCPGDGVPGDAVAMCRFPVPGEGARAQSEGAQAS